MAITTIQLDRTVRDQLKAVGKKGETYSEIIQRLLAVARYADFLQEQYRILRDEKRWVHLRDLA